MVLGQPHRVHAAGLGFIHQCKTLGKGFLLTHPVTTGELDEQPDLHARSPFSPRLRPLETLRYFLGCDGWYRNARPRQVAVLAPSRKLCRKPGKMERARRRIIHPIRTAPALPHRLPDVDGWDRPNRPSLAGQPG